MALVGNNGQDLDGMARTHPLLIFGDESPQFQPVPFDDLQRCCGGRVDGHAQRIALGVEGRYIRKSIAVVGIEGSPRGTCINRRVLSEQRDGGLATPVFSGETDRGGETVLTAFELGGQARVSLERIPEPHRSLFIEFDGGPRQRVEASDENVRFTPSGLHLLAHRAVQGIAHDQR